MFFQSKHGCFAFSQFRFSGELVVAKLERGVFGFLPMCATKGEIYFTRCGQQNQETEIMYKKGKECEDKNKKTR